MLPGQTPMQQGTNFKEPGTPSPFLQHQENEAMRKSINSLANMATKQPGKLNNDIRQLVRPGQVRLVNLDLDSPRMRQAMEILGYEKEDLDNKKRRDHFRDELQGATPIG